jgi:hypothetical protein
VSGILYTPQSIKYYLLPQKATENNGEEVKKMVGMNAQKAMDAGHFWRAARIATKTGDIGLRNAAVEKLVEIAIGQGHLGHAQRLKARFGLDGKRFEPAVEPAIVEAA